MSNKVIFEGYGGINISKYFKIIEIDADEFITETGEDLDCCQLIVPTEKALFVAVDEEYEDEIQIPLDCFEKEIEEV